MTSNKDLIQSHAGGFGSQAKSTDVSAHSTELEEILNNLGHAIADSHQHLDDNLRELGSRARKLSDQAGDAKKLLCEEEADVFSAIEDQMADLAQRAGSAGETSGVDDGAGSWEEDQNVVEESNLDLEWDQKAADELARIYNHMDGDVADDHAVSDQIADDLLAEDDEASAGDLSPSDLSPSDLSPSDLGANPDTADDHTDDGEALGTAFAGDGPDNIDTPLVLETIGAFEQSNDDAPAVSAVEAGSVEDRLSEIALRIEQALGAEKDGSSLQAIENRFDVLEEKMNLAIRHPEDVEAIRALEVQIADLSQQFSQAETQISRISTIEQNIEYLIQEVENSKANDGALMMAMPQGGETGASLVEETIAHGGRIENLRAVLEDYIHGRREGDQQTAGALSSIQSGINVIADHIAPQTTALIADVVTEPEIEVEAETVVEAEVGVDVDINAAVAVDESMADEMDAGHASDDQEVLQSPALNAHGQAQAAFAEEVASPEEAAPAEVAFIDNEEELAVGGFDVSPAEQAEPAGAINVSTEDSSVSEASETPQNDADVARREFAEAAPEKVASARDEMIKAARDAANSVASSAPVEDEGGQTGSSARDFLASARDAAKAAAERAALEGEAEEQKKQAKKKRGFFSRGRNPAHPALIGATLMLTATTAGLVYSQIKDRPVDHLASNKPVQHVQKNNVGPKVDPVAWTNPKTAKSDARVTSSTIVHTASLRGENADGRLIGEVPHHRSADDNGMDVPVGIVVNEPAVKPDLKQIAAMQRRQALAKMSSDLTKDGPSLSATEIALRPSTASLAENRAPQKSKVPSLALPPAAIGPFSLRVAAAKGDAGSQFEVATRYAQGRGVKRDYGQAIKWYSRSATQGHAIAQYRLAALYEKGHGVSKDLGRARIWYRRSADKGNIKAMHNLAVLFTGRSGSHPDYSSAAQWFKMAAERGLADSQYNLAILYANGLGVKRSKLEAYKWFSLASSRGDTQARKRHEALNATMSASEISSAAKLVDKWQGKPAVSGANSARAAALALKKSGLNVDKSARQMIANAQALLGKLGYRPGPADGQMGPKTRDAIRTFEKRSGMKVTGTVSPQLISRLSGLAS